MPQEATEAGYQTVRRLINSGETAPDQWDYVELRDDSGSAITRIQISNDSRANWTASATDQTQVLEIELSGSDSDIPTPVTIVSSVLYDTDSGGDELHQDTFDDAPLSNDSDSVIVEHSIETPEV